MTPTSAFAVFIHRQRFLFVSWTGFQNVPEIRFLESTEGHSFIISLLLNSEISTTLDGQKVVIWYFGGIEHYCPHSEYKKSQAPRSHPLQSLSGYLFRSVVVVVIIVFFGCSLNCSPFEVGMVWRDRRHSLRAWNQSPVIIIATVRPSVRPFRHKIWTLLKDSHKRRSSAVWEGWALIDHDDVTDGSVGELNYF